MLEEVFVSTFVGSILLNKKHFLKKKKLNKLLSFYYLNTKRKTNGVTNKQTEIKQI